MPVLGLVLGLLYNGLGVAEHRLALLRVVKQLGQPGRRRDELHADATPMAVGVARARATASRLNTVPCTWRDHGEGSTRVRKDVGADAA